jgi:predicted CXXCH cytochrome family protein
MFPVARFLTLLLLTLFGPGAVPGTFAATPQPPTDPILRHLGNQERLEPELPKFGMTNAFVTSASCQTCHAPEYASWRKTYHRTMTQQALPENVVGRFDGSTVLSGGLPYRVFREGDAFWADMPDPDVMMYIVQGGRKLAFDEVPRKRLPVVMTTGSHHYQTYWVASPRYDRLLQTLPLVYLIADDQWIPREDAFLRGPHDTERFITQWNHHCIRCHSTGGKPGLEPTTGQLRTEVAELGISCEACHGPGVEHVRVHTASGALHTAEKPSSAADPTIVNPARLDSRRSTHVCGLCHGVHLMREEFAMEFAHHGPQFRPGDDLEEKFHLIQHPRVEPTPLRLEELRKNPGFFAERWWDDGSLLAGGREFTGLAASACYTRGTMSCLSCHRMHGSDPNDQLRKGMDGPAACTQCHGGPKYTTDLQQHTHHPLDSEGSHCLNCHMPHTTYALLSAIRSHQIQSPHVRSSARHGVPNACNLCHLDQTLAWTQKHLVQWYGQTPVPLTAEQTNTSAALLWLLKGHAAQRVITAWHLGWKPAHQASGADWLAPFQAQLLADDYGVVRYVADHQLRKLPGFEDHRANFLSPTNRWAADVAAVRDRWKALTPKPSRRGAAVLIGENGQVAWEAAARLWKERDQRPITVSE